MYHLKNSESKSSQNQYTSAPPIAIVFGSDLTTYNPSYPSPNPIVKKPVAKWTKGEGRGAYPGPALIVGQLDCVQHSVNTPKNKFKFV